MADKTLYWLWMQHCLGYAAKVRKLLFRYGSAENFYLEGERLWRSEKLGKPVLERLLNSQPSDFQEILDLCKEHKITVLTPDSEHYPEKLLEIENYPLVLYVRGDYKSLNNRKNIAVIGSRTPCVYGERAVEKIVSRLVEADYTVVSGGALGIDSLAHKNAMDYGGKTLLVMGCGHGNGYLSENSSLRKRVAFNGALISEYPPLSPVTRTSFPERNRIISALSRGVVIVEAAERSGTINTANWALKQNRDLFVLPGDIESGNFTGSNKLITDGAIPVFSGEDILSFYGEKTDKEAHNGMKTGTPFVDIEIDSLFSKKKHQSTKIKKPSKVKAEPEETSEKKIITEKCEKKEKNSPEGISKNAAIVYNIMSDGVCTLDDIKRESKLDISKVLVALTELEMLSYAESDGPNSYKLK